MQAAAQASNPRRVLRWIGLGSLLLALGIAGAFAYLNWVGLPGFVKERLVAELRARGLDLGFRRLRLDGYRTVVAERLELGRATEPLGPKLSIDSLEVRFDLRALLRLTLKPSALYLRGGRLVWPLAATNEATPPLVLDRISTELRFAAADTWQLPQFQALFLGMGVRLTANLTNASQLRAWRWRPQPAPAGAWAARWRALRAQIEHTSFAAPPVVEIVVAGDAARPASFTAEVGCRAAGAQTAGAQAAAVSVSARLAADPATNGVFLVTSRAQVERVQSVFGEARAVQANARLRFGLTNDLPPQAQWSCVVDQPRTAHGRLDVLQLEGVTDLANAEASDPTDASAAAPGAVVRTRLQAAARGWASQTVHTPEARLQAEVITARTNVAEFRAQGRLEADHVSTQWGNAGRTWIEAHVRRPAGPRRAAATTQASPLDPRECGFWASLAEFAADWRAGTRDVVTPQLRVEDCLAAGSWLAPTLALTNLQVRLYDGRLDATATLDVPTRTLQSQARLDFDLRGLDPLFTEATRRFFNQFDWTTPPRLEAQIALTLPAWTNRAPDWRGEVQPTVRVDGEFEAPAGGAFRGVPVRSARAHFSLSNSVWRLPDLVAEGPGGRVGFSYTGDMRTHDYVFDVQARLDPNALRPLLDAQAQRGLAFFQLSQPPWVDGRIWGRWRAPERTGFAARVAATNFTFRGETCRVFSAAVVFTNRLLHATNVYVRRDEGEIHVPALALDLAAHQLWLTNAISTVDPSAVARAIGPQTTRTLEPYRFDTPPLVTVSGRLPTRGNDADALFDVSGGPFSYWRFKLPQVQARVHWTPDRVTLTNLVAAFYEGQLAGDLEFREGGEAADTLRFHAVVRGADLRPFMADVLSKTNRTQGRVDADLTITSANPADWHSWQGFGDVTLSDGLLWEVPLFGYFSHLLNAFSPGLGSTRASAGSATFTIRDSVIRSDDLLIYEPSARLRYRGLVDFEGNVNARVEAELLRNTAMFGRLFSLALWPVTKLFEYKVTGTLAQPKVEPLYFLPRLLQIPLHPLRTLGDLWPGRPAKEPPAPAPSAPNP